MNVKLKFVIGILLLLLLLFLLPFLITNFITKYEFNIKNSIKGESLLMKLEHSLSPYVAFGIMPLFALANAGVSLEGVSINTMLEPVPLGILCGLFFGKQIGVFLFSYLSIKLKLAEMPSNSNWIKLYGVGILTGIGFTMSLFVGNLAFVDHLKILNHLQ